MGTMPSNSPKSSYKNLKHKRKTMMAFGILLKPPLVFLGSQPVLESPLSNVTSPSRWRMNWLKTSSSQLKRSRKKLHKKLHKKRIKILPFPVLRSIFISSTTPATLIWEISVTGYNLKLMFNFSIGPMWSPRLNV